MNDDPFGWCHHCDEPVEDYEDFSMHASNGHAVTNGRCPGDCQFARPEFEFFRRTPDLRFLDRDS